MFFAARSSSQNGSPGAGPSLPTEAVEVINLVSPSPASSAGKPKAASSSSKSKASTPSPNLSQFKAEMKVKAEMKTCKKTTNGPVRRPLKVDLKRVRTKVHRFKPGK